MASKQFYDPAWDQYAQDTFQKREVGLNHPDNKSHIRLHNNGDVEITAGEGLSIWLHAGSRSITFVADSIKFITRDDGLHWNRLNFNKDAWQFNESTFYRAEDVDARKGLYRGVEMFLKDE